MGIIARPRPVKLFTGIITSPEDVSKETEKALCKNFGAIDYKSGPIEFSFTSYYEKDMGPNLKRYFLSFAKLIDPARLSSIKKITNKIEAQVFRNIKGLKRPVNIDPGYINDAKLVLASTKDYSHRIYLDKGIYAEVTLCYQDGDFRPQGWTYPDYKTHGYMKAFKEIREIFMQQRKQAL